MSLSASVDSTLPSVTIFCHLHEVLGIGREPHEVQGEVVQPPHVRQGEPVEPLAFFVPVFLHDSPFRIQSIVRLLHPGIKQSQCHVYRISNDCAIAKRIQGLDEI